MGRGIYKFPELTGSANISSSFTISDNATVVFTSDALIQAENLLKEKGIEYMITGPSALTRFHQHLSRKLIHLIYVIKGAGEYAASTLSEHKLPTFLNPSGKQVDFLITNLEERDFFVIREYSRLEGSIKGRATIERAIVDTYFEATRYRIPFSELEVGRVIANAFNSQKLSISQLLYFADRHGIKSEFQSIIRELEPDIPLSSGVNSKIVEKVIAGIRSY